MSNVKTMTFDRMTPTQLAIRKECEDLAEFLIAKNRAYGNSFQQPIGIFAKTTPVEQLKIRIDDKLNRLKNGSEFPGDDTILDLIGYLVLLRVLTNGDAR